MVALFKCVCWLFSVCWLFIFKDTEPSPLQDSFSVRQQGGLPVTVRPSNLGVYASGRFKPLVTGFPETVWNLRVSDAEGREPISPPQRSGWDHAAGACKLQACAPPAVLACPNPTASGCCKGAQAHLRSAIEDHGRFVHGIISAERKGLQPTTSLLRSSTLFQ